MKLPLVLLECKNYKTMLENKLNKHMALHLAKLCDLFKTSMKPRKYIIK